MIGPLYMDFCPSEEFDSVEECPDSPFVAACCYYNAPPVEDDEIRRFLAGRGKTPAARLDALKYIRQKIDDGHLGLQALCLTRTAENMLDDGCINCIPEESRKFVMDMSRMSILSAAEMYAERFAEDMNVPKKRVIKIMTLLIMSYGCAVGFLEKEKAQGTLTPGTLEIITDKIPGGGKKMLLLEKAKARLQAPRRAHLESYGTNIAVNPLHDKADDPCGILIADCLASTSAGIIEYIRNPRTDDGSPIKRAGNIPTYSEEQKTEIEEITDYLLKQKHLVHLTTEMLMAMANMGPDMMRGILGMQKDFGLEYTKYIDPEEFITPEASGQKDCLFPIHYVRFFN